jgi:TPR repeat protein
MAGALEILTPATARHFSFLGLAAGLLLCCVLVLKAKAQEARLPELPRNPTKAEDQYELGRRMEHGLGLQANLKKAMEWYAKAAEQGHPAAQARLGQAYEEGSGVKRDTEEALKWFRKAAEQGHADSQNHLGFLHFVGRRVAHDDQQAERWFRKAAEQGHAEAQSYLGIMLADKSSLPADYIQAHMWLQLSEEGGYGLAAMQREDIERRMTSTQIEEAKRRADEWRAKRKAGGKPLEDDCAAAESRVSAQ